VSLFEIFLCLDGKSEELCTIADMSFCRFIQHLENNGFYRQGSVSFPHKESAVMRTDRESWIAPAI